MEEKLTVQRALADFADAYEAKKQLIEEQRNDHLFALGKQWEDKDVRELEKKGVKAITDNRIRPNIFLLTGLERQNRTDFRAYPEGEEDTLSAQIATNLLKNVMKQSDGEFKFSEMFENGITCGEDYIELWLDSTYNLINPRPRWRGINFDCIFPERGWKEYDFSDASYVYKISKGIKKGDLISLFPEQKKKIEEISSGLIESESLTGGPSVHYQGSDYPKESRSGVIDEERKKDSFDLLERYYKKWVERVFVLDAVEGDVIESTPVDKDDKRTAEEIASDFIRGAVAANPNNETRFRIIKRTVPEIWYFALTGGLNDPLADERAWFYPKWKTWPFIPYLAHWTNITLDRSDYHLTVQGIVRGSKDAQIEHNKRKTQYLRHLDTSANSGWLTPTGSWVDRKKVEEFGSAPGINLEYKPELGKPERIFPTPLSQGHVFSSQESAESIKAQTGINADLLAVQDGGQASGRAIALRQRQGVVNVQKLFDNLSRTKKIAAKFIISQLSEIYDKQSVRRVLGDAFLRKNFSRQELNELTGQVEVVFDEKSQSQIDRAIDQVLNDINLGKYDVSVGESVMSETMRLSQFSELKEFATAFQGLISPEIIISESNLPPSVKQRILSDFERNRAAAQANQRGGNPNG